MPNWFPESSVEWLVVFVGLAMVAVLILPPLRYLLQSIEPTPYRFSFGEVVTLKITGQKVSVARGLGNNRVRILYADNNGHLEEIDVWDRDLVPPGIED